MKGRVVTIKFVRTRGQHNSYQSFVSFPPRKNKKTEKKKLPGHQKSDHTRNGNCLEGT